MYFLQNTHTTSAGQAAPPGVHGPHHPATCVTQQHGQAIRHHDAASYPTLTRVGPISGQIIRGILTQFHEFCAMDLVEIHRARRRQPFLQLRPIPQHIGCFITDM